MPARATARRGVGVMGGGAKASIADVARAAGTSTGTVSRVLNGGYVAPATRERVIAAIERLDYTPRLLSNRQRRLCVYLTHVARTIGHAYEAEIIHGLGEAIAQRDVQMLLLTHAERDDETALKSIRELRPDLLLVIGQSPERFLDLRREVAGLVQVGDWDAPHPALVYAAQDNRAAAVQSVRYLQRKGHRRIALVYSGDTSPSQRNFRRGYEEQLRDGACPVVVRSLDEVSQRVLRLVTAPEPPTALLLSRPRYVLPVLQALHFGGLRVPGDCSIVAQEETQESGYMVPPLTTFAFGPSELGRAAGELVLALLGDRPLPARHVRVPPTIIERNSVASRVD